MTSEEYRFYSLALGVFFKNLRDKRGWSQEELASRCGFPQNRISRIESGQLFSHQAFQQLTAAFDLAPEQLSARLSQALQRARTLSAVAPIPKPSDDAMRGLLTWALESLEPGE